MPHIHPDARTAPVIRAEIARSGEPWGVVAKRYGVSAGTVRWLGRRRGGDDLCAYVVEHLGAPSSVGLQAPSPPYTAPSRPD